MDEGSSPLESRCCGPPGSEASASYEPHSNSSETHAATCSSDEEGSDSSEGPASLGPLPTPTIAEILRPWDMNRYCLQSVVADAPRSGGTIELHEDLCTGELIAVKRIRRDRVCESPEAYDRRFPYEVDDPWTEVRIALFFATGGRMRDVPGVCRFRGAFVSEDGDAMIATEYLSAGDMFDFVTRREKSSGPRENEAWPIMLSLMSAVSALHAHGIAHGDISLENMLLRKVQPLEIALIDFGMAVTHDWDATTGIRGKPAYQAPEMHTDATYDARAADWFACGVVAYALAVGAYPWNSTRPDVCRAFSVARKFGLQSFFGRRRMATAGGDPALVADCLTDGYRHLLMALLDFNPTRRLGNAELMGKILTGAGALDMALGA